MWRLGLGSDVSLGVILAVFYVHGAEPKCAYIQVCLLALVFNQCMGTLWLSAVKPMHRDSRDLL